MKTQNLVFGALLAAVMMFAFGAGAQTENPGSSAPSSASQPASKSTKSKTPKKHKKSKKSASTSTPSK